MALIVLMEDDAATRTLVSSVLKKDGHEVLAADNGQDGLDLILQHQPALVISDVQMPRMNGFEVLAAVRQEGAVASTPVILLTSLQERAHMRIGMTSGADDYITKPFRPGELRDAVAAQLNKRQMQASLQALAIDAALIEQRNELARLYETRLAHELSERWPSGQGGSGDERFESATVLFVDIPQYAEVAHKLNPGELGDLVKKLYMQFIGEGLLAVFSDDTNTRTVNHGLRAARAALGVVESARGIGNYLEATYAGRQLPPFSVHVALNTGPLALTLLQDPLHGGMQKLPVGDVVSTTMQLQRKARDLGWPVALSVGTLRMVTGAVRTGRRALVELPGRAQPLDAVELAGLALPADDA
ncbi:MAG: response regulator [Comamonadaceae bacterium]|nr:MAG: response regulator [Comamonadaceae bacterium]